MLQTAKSRNLREITICPDAIVGGPVSEVALWEWRDLDCFMFELWTLCSIILKIIHEEERGGLDLEDLVLELTGRGIIDLVGPNCTPFPSLPHQPTMKSPASDYCHNQILGKLSLTVCAKKFITSLINQKQRKSIYLI